MTPREIMAGFHSRHEVKKKRTNWRDKFKRQRAEVIDEAIAKIRDEMRCKPKEWRNGYYSAITQLELMK